MSPTDFGFAKLISMHDESSFANSAVFNVQPRFTVALPPHGNGRSIHHIANGINYIKSAINLSSAVLGGRNWASES